MGIENQKLQEENGLEFVEVDYKLIKLRLA
jgi:hypothetical protein